MDSNSLKIWLLDMTNKWASDMFDVDETQVLPNGDLAFLLDDGTLIRVKLDVQVQPPSQLAQTEIL